MWVGTVSGWVQWVPLKSGVNGHTVGCTSPTTGDGQSMYSQVCPWNAFAIMLLQTVHFCTAGILFWGCPCQVCEHDVLQTARGNLTTFTAYRQSGTKMNWLDFEVKGWKVEVMMRRLDMVKITCSKMCFLKAVFVDGLLWKTSWLTTAATSVIMYLCVCWPAGIFLSVSEPVALRWSAWSHSWVC